MKRPAVVWLYSIMIAFGVLFEILAVIGSIVGTFTEEGKILYLVLFFLNAVVLVVDSFFLYYFFMLKEKAKTWVHISFGATLLYVIIGDIIQYIQQPENAGISYFLIIAGAIMWWAVYDYIKKKKVDDKLLFSN